VYGPLICFDSIYESLTIQSLRDGAQVLVISTNDSWFYDSAAGRMHVAQAKLRAVESRRWVLRAANTGVSAVITPNGQAVETLRQLVGGYIVAEAGVRDNMTLYMRVGNIIVAAAALFCLLPVVMALFSGALPPKIILQTPRQHR
jgi:apolipoprotein N-acyltransferase